MRDDEIWCSNREHLIAFRTLTYGGGHPCPIELKVGQDRDHSALNED